MEMHAPDVRFAIPVEGCIAYEERPHEWRGLRRNKNVSACFTLAAPGCLDGGNVDLLHCHHGLECALCLTAASRQRIG